MSSELNRDNGVATDNSWDHAESLRVTISGPHILSKDCKDCNICPDRLLPMLLDQRSILKLKQMILDTAGSLLHLIVENWN